jgi:large subunit ribosomal protein L21
MSTTTLTSPYAVIVLAGKQYTVSQGDTFIVDRLPDISVDETNEFKIADVLLTKAGDTITVGKPLVKGASVTLKVLDQMKGPKLRVATYKSKSRYRRVIGHRQHQTKVEVISIKA